MISCRPLFFALALAALAAMSACQRIKPIYELTPEFSVNLVRSTLDDINVRTLPQAQQEIYDRYGPPQFMRLLYNHDGELTLRREQITKLSGRRIKSLERTWVYTDRGVEVQFRGEADIETRPLTDMIRTVCDNGDPERINRYGENSKNPYVELVYWAAGKRFKFNNDGVLLSTGEFPKMGVAR